MENSRISLSRLPLTLYHYLASLRLYFSRVRPGLRIKLIFVVVAVALIGILTSSTFMFGSLRQQYIEQVKISTARSNRMLIAGLEHDMLTHDTTMLNEVIRDVAREFHGEQIRILDAGGYVQGSSVPEESGILISKTDQKCKTCHNGGTGEAMVTETIYRLPQSGGQELLSVTPITNKPQCTSCHDASIKTLGILYTQAPLTDLTELTQEGLRRVGFAALMTFAILVGLMVPALHKTILEPIGNLSKGVTEIDSENLDYQIHANSRDELGQLVNAFDEMREHLKISRAATEQRSQELSILYELARITSQLADLHDILNSALDIIIQRLYLDVGVIYLWDKIDNRFEMVTSRGFSERQLALIDQKRQQPGGDLTLDVAKLGKVFFVPDVSQDRHFIGDWEDPHGRSYVNVPLISQGKVVGTLELISRAGQPMTSRLVEVLTVVGNQIGIAIDNHALLTETQRSAREALTLSHLSAEVSSSLELELVLNAIARGASQALAGDIGVVVLVDEDHQNLVIRSLSEERLSPYRGLRAPLTNTGAYTSAKIIDLQKHQAGLSEPLAEMLRSERITSILMVPLLRGEQFQGTVAVLTRSQRKWIDEEIRLLERLANQVVIAIENARLYQQVHYMAVLEERDRLAREMHDDLAQTLGYLNIKASITGDLIANGKAGQAQESLLEMKEIARNAYTNTREAIFHLRSAVPLGVDLIPTLRQYLAEYSSNYGLEAQLVVEEGAPVNFPADLTIQLSRIIQEALTNIRKHARATQTWVRFEVEENGARIVIEDNGSGFTLEKVGSDGEKHFGIQIMRERAESVGAKIEFIPQVGYGTRVVIHVPA